MSQMFNENAIISLKSQQLRIFHRVYHQLSAIFGFSVFGVTAQFANWPAQNRFSSVSCKLGAFKSSNSKSRILRFVKLSNPQHSKSPTPRVSPLFVWKINQKNSLIQFRSATMNFRPSDKILNSESLVVAKFTSKISKKYCCLIFKINSSPKKRCL